MKGEIVGGEKSHGSTADLRSYTALIYSFLVVGLS